MIVTIHIPRQLPATVFVSREPLEWSDAERRDAWSLREVSCTAAEAIQDALDLEDEPHRFDRWQHQRWTVLSQLRRKIVEYAWAEPLPEAMHRLEKEIAAGPRPEIGRIAFERWDEEEDGDLPMEVEDARSRIILAYPEVFPS